MTSENLRRIFGIRKAKNQVIQPDLQHLEKITVRIQSGLAFPSSVNEIIQEREFYENIWQVTTQKINSLLKSIIQKSFGFL